MPQDPVSDFLAQDATNLVRQKADEYGVPADFAERILDKETRKRADIISGRVRSPKGATGAMQLMPGTAARLGVKDSTDYTQNIDGGVRELARLYKQYNGDQSLVAAGYNAGEGAVKKYGGVPPYKETQGYVKEVAQDPVQQFLNKRPASPSPTPQPTSGSQKKKAPAINPFDWQTGGGVKVPLKNAARFQGTREMTGNEDGQAPSPVDPQQRAKNTVAAQSKFERGASQLYNAVAKGVARIPQGIAELSDLAGKYQPVARLGNEVQRLVTGEQPQPLAPTIAPYTQTVERAIDRDVPVDPNDQSWVTAKIPRAVGSLAPFVLGGAASGGSRAVTGLLGAAGNTADIATEFDQAGGDPANRDQALALAAATGLSEVFGVGKILAKFGANRGLMQTAKSVLEEGGQEAFQQWANNLNAASVGAYDPSRPQSQGVKDAAILGGVLGGGLSGVSNLAGRQVSPTQAPMRAPAPPVALPRSADTNLTPDEVMTPATGAQPVIDPATGLPTPEALNPASEAQMNDMFGQLLGRKPDKAAEKAQVAAQDVKRAIELADEASAAGDVNAEVAALKTALKRKPDVETEVKLQARLTALEPAAATRKLAGQRAPVESQLLTLPDLQGQQADGIFLRTADGPIPVEVVGVPQLGPNGKQFVEVRNQGGQSDLVPVASLEGYHSQRAQSQIAPETQAITQTIADAPTADLPGDLMTPQEVQAAQSVASGRNIFLQNKEAIKQAITEGRSEEAKALIKMSEDILKNEPKQANAILSPDYLQKHRQDVIFLAQMRDSLKTSEAARKAALAQQAAQAKAAKAAAPKAPKTPKVVTPRAEGVRKRQGVLKGIAPDQTTLIDNPAAMENRQGGVPPVEPVAKDVLPFEDLAAQQKRAKGERLDNIGIVRRIQELGGIEPSGEARRNGQKYPGLVREGGLSPDVLATDLAAEGYPVDPNNLDTLYEAIDRAAAGQDVYPVSKGRTKDLDADYAAYQEQQVTNEAAPTGSTRLPSGMIAEPRRPQPIETPRNTPDLKQQALDRVNAIELPERVKAGYRSQIESGDTATLQRILSDPDLAPVPQRAPVEQVQQVELRKTGTDNAPVAEMPKRATPPKPIPDDIKRVYGEKVTPEQAEAIQRRAENRASVEVGLGGKFGDMARKSFMSSRGTSELPTMVEHPALREALGLPGMSAYLVEDGRVSKLWQEAAQHTLDGLAEWGGVERSSKAGDDGLGRIQEAIAERVNDPSIDEVFMRTVVATDTAQKRLGAVLSHPDVKVAIEAAQAEIADQRARGLKSLALRKSGKALDAALEAASEQALKDFPADAIGSYGKDWSTITKNAIEEFRADLRAERLGPDGNPESWIGRRLRESGNEQDGENSRPSADAPVAQAAARPAESASGRAPAQESAGIQAQAEIVEPHVGGYIRREQNGRIYEIVKYDPRESQVRIKQPGSQMEVVIPQSEARRSVIPDAEAKAEIGEAQNEGQPSQEQPQAPRREEAPEIKDSPSEIGEGVRRAAEAAKRKLRKPEARRGERGALANPFAKSPKPEITKRDLKNKSGGRYAEVRLGEQNFQVETADAKGTVLHTNDAAVILDAQQQFAQQAFKALGEITGNTAARQEVRDQATALGRQIRDAVNRGDWVIASRLNKKLQGMKGATAFDINDFAKQAKSALNSKVIKPDTEKAILAAAQQVANGIQAGDQKAIEAGRLKLLEIQDDLKAEVNMKPTEKGVTDKIATVHSITQLLAPLTAMRNILSNAAYAAGRNIDIAVAAGIDKGISKVTGERTVLSPRSGQIADLKAEMKRAYSEIRKGNLNVMRESQFGLADHHVLDSKVGKFFEKALSVSLKVPDAGFFHAAYNESVRNQIEAQSKSVRPTQSLEQIHERAVNEALQSVFADSNALSRAAVWTKDKINLGKAWGVADVMGLRYPKVPANLLARALEHSPAGLIRELYNLSQVGQGKRDFDQRTTSINIAKSLTGTLGAATAGYLLTALGIIVREPNPDDSYGEQALQASTGLPRYGINLSAAKRYATGGIVDFLTKGDNSAGKLLRGDLTADFGWLQPHGMMLGIGSALFDERSQKQNGNALESVIGGLDAATETLSDQSILKLGRDFMRDATREGGGVGKAVGNLAYKGVVNLPASFTPGALNSLRPLFDNTWRDTRPEQPGKTVEQKGRAMAGEAVNRVMARVPGLSQRLPVRPDVTGEPRKAPQDKFANVQALLNPAKLSEYQPNDYTDALVRLGLGASYTPRFISKTGAMPEPTSRLREREIERGRAEMERGNRLVNSDSFKKADPEKQKEMIRTMRAKVTESLSGRRKSSGYPFVDAQSKEGKRAVTGGH